MLKIALIVAATAVPAFGVGWTASTMAHPRLAEATAVISPTTISPYDMQLNVKPHDLPVQYMQGDFTESRGPVIFISGCIAKFVTHDTRYRSAMS